LIEEILYRAGSSGIATLKSDTSVESPGLYSMAISHSPQMPERPADLIALADF